MTLGRSLWPALVLCLAAAAAQAQRVDLHFERIGLEDGLPQGFVATVARDSLGFMWFGTAGGLARYDGYRMDVFEPEPDDPASLRDPVVTRLLVASDGTLWVGADRGGVSRFDPATQAFVHVPVGPRDERHLPAARVNALLEGGGGGIWVLTEAGLSRVDPATGSVWHLREPGLAAGDALARAADGGVWASFRDGGLAHIAPQTRDVTRHLPGEAVPWVLDILVYDDVLWLATQEGLVRYDPASGGTRRYDDDDLQRRTPDLFIEPRGWLWLSTRDGFVLFDVDTERVLAERSNAPGNALDLPPREARELLYDRSGIFWIAALGAGAAYSDLLTSRIVAFRSEPDDPATLTSPSLRAIESEEAWIWAGMNGAGLDRIDRRTGRVERLAFPPAAPVAWGNPESRTVYGLDFDREGRLWAVVRWGVARLDAEGQPARVYPFPNADYQTLNPGFVHEDRAGRLWVGGTHVARLDASTGVYTRVLGDVGAVAVHEAPDGALWIATSSGLVRYDPASGERRAFRHDPDDPTSLSNDGLLALAAQGDSVLWVGSAAGLNRFEMATGRATRFTRANSGLPNNYINGVLVDDAGDVWVSTNHGLARVDARTEAVTALSRGRGLQGPEFNRGAAHKAADGTLMFGGIDGLNVFDPADLRENPNAPEVRLRRLVAGAEAVVPGPGALETGGRVRLHPDQDDLSFEFVGLHYADPGANRYQFLLEGVDAGWQPVTEAREARYTNVPPGTHTFRVRAANAYGVWSDDVALASVVLPPPWWASVWFRGLVLLLGVGTVVAAYRWRTADLRAREHELEAEVADRTKALTRAQVRTETQAVELERLNRQQRQLFANVSHETRTPLTLILGPVEDALAGDDVPDRLRPTLESVRRNGRRLLHLVDQILDLARLEAGEATLELRPLDLGDFAVTLTGVFEAYAESRGVDLRAEVPEAPLVGRFDVALLEHVLFNLLSNAIKFTPEGGNVRVRLGAEPADRAGTEASGEASPEVAVLRVEDTGVGIPPDEVAGVFERYARAPAGGVSGTGLGLALVREAVERHGGTVDVESTVGEGTTFTVRLPLDSHTRLQARGDAYVLSDRIPELADTAPPADADDADRTTVLVAEDDPGVRAYVADVLRPTYRVLTAEDGEAALALARASPPDLVVSDVVMPALDGLGLCAALRGDPALRYVPVVLLTARVAVEDRLEGLGVGADDYLAKPFDARELRARVDNLIAARRAWRSEAAPPPFRDAFPDAASADDRFRQRIDAAVHERFADPGFGASDLAEAVGLSGSQLRRRMQALYGRTPTQTLRAYRLRQAAGLLARRTGTVAEVAYAVGFNSVSYFTRSFGEAYGQTPTEYAEAAGDEA